MVNIERGKSFHWWFFGITAVVFLLNLISGGLIFTSESFLYVCGGIILLSLVCCITFREEEDYEYELFSKLLEKRLNGDKKGEIRNKAE